MAGSCETDACQNLVICISPNLLYDRTNSMLGSMEHMGKIQGIVTTLVQQFDYIFKVYIPLHTLSLRRPTDEGQFQESTVTKSRPVTMSKELRRENTRKAALAL